MDAREQLRRYLEQRREMGERELILDGMSVEDVMRIVGAGGGSERPNSTVAPQQVDRALDQRVPPPAATIPPDVEASDWREVLRATGSEPTRATNVTRGPASPPSAPKAATPAPPTAPPEMPGPPPAREEFDDADAPEDAVVSAPPPRTKLPRCGIIRVVQGVGLFSRSKYAGLSTTRASASS